ncbi:unnamed protein product [Peronospora farinosa]|uniref:Jacalin-type lectin domain-containing protein n=1 Tax=Peronospora farinosa TaxID=134698 RepID=A0AAV0SV71_9STRA|nr:unnamed protein product [Peronospora farinosa]CAI5709030.1 unnamed protein product [Peronospora farinosa]
MVRLFFQVFAALALVSGSPHDPECVRRTNFFGGDHGDLFEDKVDHTTNTTGIIVRASKRLDAIGIKIGNTEMPLHGGSGGELHSHDFGGRKIIGMTVHRAKHNDRTRVFYVEFTFNEGPSVTAGIKDAHRKDKDTNEEFPGDGIYLIGFHGRAGDEIDALGGLWVDTKCAKKLEKGYGDDPDDDDDDPDDDDDDPDDDDDDDDDKNN